MPLTKEQESYIEFLEKEGIIDKYCLTCKEFIYPKLNEGQKLSSIMVPGHQPARRCRSGKKAHCTCSACWG